ncbi:hypothetical protein EDC01DRAFT_756486 [Geopyxis carbonaria]|nr:hypothetical protein EDC01DRAFT_756486 [Geopyxis carbonaria]
MTSSNKKKAIKTAAFKKAKLRVGKTPKAADNFTSTSFRSKAIVLASQSLRAAAPSADTQLTHHLSLLTHHASSVRKESLQHLLAHLPPASALPRLAPLVLDTSASVRTALHALLVAVARADPAGARLHVRALLLHIHSAMSHIEPDIRGDSSRLLAWALGVSRAGTLAEGGWAVGLGALAGLVEPPSGKQTLRHVGVLREFLEAGLTEGAEEEEEDGAGGEMVRAGLHWSAPVHAKLPGVGAYAYLGLFVEGVKEGAGDDAASRRRWCRGEGKRTFARVESALRGLVKEGGEVGRVAAKTAALLEEAMATETL